jgi:hypothetical protein
MKKISIKIDKPFNRSKYIFSTFYNYIFNNSHSILITINLLINLYLLIQNSRNSYINKEILKNDCQQKNNQKIFNKDSTNFCSKSKIDKDMIGLKYPEVSYDEIKNSYSNGNIISSFCEFLTQLEIKLIYLEKEINVTKLSALYTSRTLYLKKIHINYDDSKIKEFHNIMSWLVIHKSTQLKGIASDKYLGCKYVEMKIGKNLCPQRIGVYESVEEIDFQKLVDMGNVILKVSNGCGDNVVIEKSKTKNDIEEIKKNMSFYFNREYSLSSSGFFHYYSKKRIVLEKLFIPRDDLYEFKFMVLNQEIKIIYLFYYKNQSILYSLYDANYNPIGNIRKNNFNLSIFKQKLLNEMKLFAVKLSEDFPNFIRVDLYLFHDKIYFSELTFDSNSGKPITPNINYIKMAFKNWKRIDY